MFCAHKPSRLIGYTNGGGEVVRKRPEDTVGWQQRPPLVLLCVVVRGPSVPELVRLPPAGCVRATKLAARGCIYAGKD